MLIPVFGNWTLIALEQCLPRQGLSWSVVLGHVVNCPQTGGVPVNIIVNRPPKQVTVTRCTVHGLYLAFHYNKACEPNSTSRFYLRAQYTNCCMPIARVLSHALNTAGYLH